MSLAWQKKKWLDDHCFKSAEIHARKARIRLRLDTFFIEKEDEIAYNIVAFSTKCNKTCNMRIMKP